MSQSASPNFAAPTSKLFMDTRTPSQRTRPRVLHLINTFDIGGTERQAVQLLQQFDRDRLEVQVGTLCLKGGFLNEIIRCFPTIHEFPITGFFNLNAARQLTRLCSFLKRERIDILHSWDFYANMLGAPAARLAGVQLITSQRSLKISDRSLHARGTRLAHKLAHRIVVNSEAIRAQILTQASAPQEKIVVIPNGLQLAEELTAEEKKTPREAASLRHWRKQSARRALCRELQIDEHAPLIGMVAKLRPLKGHRFFLEAALQLLRTGSPAHFVLIGGGALRKEIEQQIAALCISHRVHLLGDRLDVAQLIPGFDVAVLASTGGEGLPNSLMEAMAAGVPVAATAVSGIPELIRDGETGYLVPPSDATALAQSMARALADPEGSAAMGERGRCFVTEHFSMHRMVTAVEQLYEDLLAERVESTI